MIRGRGQLVTTTAGRGRAVGMVAAKAVAIGGISHVATSVSGMIDGNAHRIRDVILNKYLDVLPQEPQQLVWLTPQYGIDYHVIANDKWKLI